MTEPSADSVNPGRPAAEVLEPGPDVVAQRVGDGVVIVNLRTNRMYDLNGTAARLWDLVTTGHDVRGIHGRLLQEFEVDPGQLTREIDAVVASLKEAGLVREAQRA